MCLCRLATRPTFDSNYDEEEDDDDDERIPRRSDQAFKKMDFVPNQVVTSLGVLAIQLSNGNLNMMVVSSWLKQPIFQLFTLYRLSNHYNCFEVLLKDVFDGAISRSHHRYIPDGC